MFDWATFIGTIGLFLTLLFLFVRFLPAISIFEMRTILPGAECQGGGGVSRRHPDIYGLMAEFHTPARGGGRRAAASTTRATRKVDAYSPYPIEELSEALHIAPLAAAQARARRGDPRGSSAGSGLEYWASVIEYPMNIGGRPFNAWPAFIVPAFETTILFAAAAAVLGMLALNGLPEPYHPVFNVPELRPRHPRQVLHLHRGARSEVRPRRARGQFLRGLGATEVSEVEH